MTFVPIDRSTLRWLPAHDGRYIVPGKPETTVKVLQGQVCLTVTQPAQFLFAFPQGPHWDFRYAPTSVKCEYCGCTCLHTELESDSVWAGDDYGEVEVERICPYCKRSDCCELEYEKEPPPPEVPHAPA